MSRKMTATGATSCLQIAYYGICISTSTSPYTYEVCSFRPNGEDGDKTQYGGRALRAGRTALKETNYARRREEILSQNGPRIARVRRRRQSL